MNRRFFVIAAFVAIAAIGITAAMYKFLLVGNFSNQPSAELVAKSCAENFEASLAYPPGTFLASEFHSAVYKDARFTYDFVEVLGTSVDGVHAQVSANCHGHYVGPPHPHCQGDRAMGFGRWFAIDEVRKNLCTPNNPLNFGVTFNYRLWDNGWRLESYN